MVMFYDSVQTRKTRVVDVMAKYIYMVIATTLIDASNDTDSTFVFDSSVNLTFANVSITVLVIM